MKKILTLACALALAACGTESAPTEQAPTPAAQEASWPRTVSLGETSIEIAAEPQRIVALTTETSDLALALAGAERMAAVASGSQTEGTGNMLEEAMKVDRAFKVNSSPEPEQILALDPDLVITTGRHDNEASLADTLAQSGIPILTFDSSNFSSPEDVKASIETLGEVLGAEDKAGELTEKITADQAEAEKVKGDDKPRTMVLMARGGSLMIAGSTSATTKLVELAGGTSIAGEMGWRQSVAADPETILTANPDVILVQDFRDQGMAPFEELLSSDALSEIPAIAHGRVELIDAETTSGTASFRIGEGQLAIATILKG